MGTVLCDGTMGISGGIPALGHYIVHHCQREQGQQEETRAIYTTGFYPGVCET